jgi:ribulose-phosphate 3-epimerase
MTLVPAVIPQSRAHVAETVRLVRTFATALQVDVVDGQFAPQTSWPYGEGDMAGSPRDIADLLDGLEIEVDIMALRPETALDAWADIGVRRIVVHAESTQELHAAIAHARGRGYALGLAFDDDTPIDRIAPYLSEVSFVQCMGIDHVGAQGEPFEERVLHNIEAIKSRFPALPISVDGSVNAETLPRLKAAGASRFIAGSAIFNTENPRAAYEQLAAIAAR